MDPIVADSARRHGISDADMLHAYRNPIRLHMLDDMDMLVGADRSGRLLEIGVTVDDDEWIAAIVHAMPVRSRFLE